MHFEPLGSRPKTKNYTASVDRIIQRKIKLDRRKSTPTVKPAIEKGLDVIVHANTIRNRLHEIGLYGRVARKKSYVNKINRGKRIAYAKMMMEKPYEYWKHVLWSDKSKFNLFGSDGKIMVWRSTMEEYDPKRTVPTVKYNGGSVIVWACFSRSGVGNLCFIEGNMDRFLYREILRKDLLQSCQKLGLENSFVFQHDNDPKQIAGMVKDWLKQKKTETLNWPPCSPDMNPIEHLWDELERRMKKQRGA